MERIFEPSLKKVLTFLVLISHAYAISNSETIPFDEGKNYYYGWIIEMGVGSLGVLSNVLCITMMLSLEDSNKMSFYSINLSINFIDLAFAIGRVVFSSIYWSVFRIYGGNLTCQIESFLNMTLLLWSSLAVIEMAWVARNELCYGIKISQRRMLVMIMWSLVYSSAVSIIVIYLPYGGYELEPSGTFCFLGFGTLVGAPFMYMFGWILPLVVLFYNLYLTYITIKKAQVLLLQHDIKAQAKGHYIKMVTKMGYFMMATMNCYSPFLFGSVYEWWTQQYIPGWYSVAAGVPAMLLACFINPCLFFYLNPDLRLKFDEKITKRILHCVRKHKTLLLFSQRLGVKISRNSRKIAVHPSSSKSVSLFSVGSEKSCVSLGIPFQELSNKSSRIENRLGMLMQLGSPRLTRETLNYKDTKVWLSDPMLFDAFKKHGQSEYSSENFLFYEDAKAHYVKGMQLLSKLSSFMHYSNQDGSSLSNEIINMWSELESLGARIYTLYLNVPSAPLEINIPSHLRSKVIKILVPNITKNNKPPPKYPDLDACYRDGQDVAIIVEKYTHVFDECALIIKMILETDIFPRFVRSNLYRTTRDKHRKSLPDV